MSTPYATGDNFTLVLDGGHAVLKVWRRPDLDSASGARNANEMAAHLRALMPKLASLIFDLRDAPPVAGPKTVETVSELLRSCEQRAVRIAVVLSADPMQLLQYRRLVATYAPARGKAVMTLAEAEAHVRPKPPARR